MEHETSTARAVRRIAAELGVPVSFFYDQNAASPSDHEAMQKAVAALLSAFVAVSDPDERQRCITRLGSEVERLRELPKVSDG